jgi:CDP-glycerol glycerophosphotransferase (TagB/SpsB family)
VGISNIVPRRLLVRVARRASSSDKDWVRRLFALLRATYRFVGRTIPALHLGWTSSLRQASWDDDGALSIRGWAYTRGTGYEDPPHIEVWLHRRLSMRRISATVTPVLDPDVRGAARRAEFDYANTGFEARWEPAVLERLGRRSVAQVRVQVTGSDRRYWGAFRRRYALGSVATMRLRHDIQGSVVGPRWSDRRGLLVLREPVGTTATAVRAVDRQLQVTIDRAVRRAMLVGDGGQVVELDVEATVGGATLTGQVPDRVPVADPVTGRVLPASWKLLVVPRRRRRPVRLTSPDLGLRPNGSNSLLVRGDDQLGLEVVDVPVFVEVDRAWLESDTLLCFEGTMVGPDCSLTLAGRRSAIPVEIVERDGDRFSARAHLRVSAWGGPELPPKADGYALQARLDDEPVATFVENALCQVLPKSEDTPEYRLRIGLERRDQLRLQVGRPRRPNELGSFNQAKLQHSYNHHAQPRDAVFLESFFGRNATCNPRAIDAEIARRHPDLPRFWAVDDLSIAVPEGAQPVVVGTTEWWQARTTSRWVVTNEWLRTTFRKQPFQTVLQTWHGSMYKKIGLDRDMNSRHQRLLREERAHWDMFISQNSASTPIIQSAYDFDLHEILEIGYPRNDELHDNDAERRADIRRRLGVPDDVRLAMYAPTWRPVAADGSDALLVDLPRLAGELGPEWTVLLRGHVRTLGRSDAVETAGVIDVGTYPQVSDLFLVADVLITDYSSMMFDYSVTGKPIVFFAPDIDQYTDDRVRGTYFDLEALAPGPVVRTQDEVRDLLLDDLSWHDGYADRYREWQGMFNHHDDGKAASRATDALFRSEQPR